MKVEIAIGNRKKNGKYPVVVATNRGNPVINTENIAASSLFGTNDIDVFSDSWELSEDEIEELLNEIMKDCQYLAENGEESIIEVGGPGSIELNKNSSTRYVHVPQNFIGPVVPQEDVPLIVFHHNGAIIHVTSIKPLPQGKKVTQTELWSLINAYFQAINNKIEIEKRKKAIKRHRMELPTNISDKTLTMFIKISTPQRIKAIFPLIESIKMNPIEKMISGYNTLYNSFNSRKFLVIDPRAKIFTAISSLIYEGYDINAIGVNLWTYGNIIQMTPNSFITVKGLIVSFNQDSHMALMSMYNRYGNKTSRITDDFYDMLSMYGIERKHAREIISQFRGKPISQISTIQEKELSSIITTIYNSDAWKEVRKEFEFLPEEFQTPFALYMIEKRETLPIISQPTTRANIPGLTDIIKKTIPNL